MKKHLYSTVLVAMCTTSLFAQGVRDGRGFQGEGRSIAPQTQGGGYARKQAAETQNQGVIEGAMARVTAPDGRVFFGQIESGRLRFNSRDLARIKQATDASQPGDMVTVEIGGVTAKYDSYDPFWSSWCCVTVTDCPCLPLPEPLPPRNTGDERQQNFPRSQPMPPPEPLPPHNTGNERLLNKQLPEPLPPEPPYPGPFPFHNPGTERQIQESKTIHITFSEGGQVQARIENGQLMVSNRDRKLIRDRMNSGRGDVQINIGNNGIVISGPTDSIGRYGCWLGGRWCGPLVDLFDWIFS